MLSHKHSIAKETLWEYSNKKLVNGQIQFIIAIKTSWFWVLVLQRKFSMKIIVRGGVFIAVQTVVSLPLFCRSHWLWTKTRMLMEVSWKKCVID